MRGCPWRRRAGHDAPRPIFAAGTPEAGSIAIAPVLARGLAGDRRYTYVAASAPGELRQAATFFWEEPPPRVLERALADALRTRYAQVYPVATPLPADRRVVATLTRFEEEDAWCIPPRNRRLRGERHPCRTHRSVRGAGAPPPPSPTPAAPRARAHSKPR
ncbi:hypothetical protein AB5I41_12130 [Sphingomonas sp. MMS24-JH45]